MTRVDFYILADGDAGAADQFACRLAEKAHHAQLRIFLRTADAQTAERLDTLLWTFRQGSFVPHRLTGQPDHAALPTPVVVGQADDADRAADLCINVARSIPPDNGRWQRIAEIVPGTDAEKAAARERFRHYRLLGCDMHTHNVTA